MKTFVLVFFIFCSSLIADEFDDLVDKQKSKPPVFPMTEAEIRQYVPLIPRMLTDDEKQKLKKQAKEKQKKISKNFTSEENLEKSEKVKTDININDTDADFFNSLNEKDASPINIE